MCFRRTLLAGFIHITLPWRHNGRNGVLNNQPRHCLLNRLFRHRPKKTSKLRVTGPCAGNSPVTGEFPAQAASNAENVSIWWRHHDRRGNVIYQDNYLTTVPVPSQHLVNDGKWITDCMIACTDSRDCPYVIPLMMKNNYIVCPSPNGNIDSIKTLRHETFTAWQENRSQSKPNLFEANQ